LRSTEGHKSITTTERYSHLGNAGVHTAYPRLVKFLNDFVPTGVPNELSEAEKEERKELEAVGNNWWRRGDSNARPRDYETRESDSEIDGNVLKGFELEEDTLP